MIKIPAFKLFLKYASRVNKNTFWIILLNIIIALSQFVILSLITHKLGKEILGIWSLVIAATSIGQVSGFGFSNGLVRYLPEFFIKKEFEKAETMVATVNIANFFFSLPLMFLLYFPIMLYANHLLKGAQLNIFHSVIIWNLIALFINNLFMVYSFIFDALQKYYIRCFIQIAGWLLFLVVSIVLMPAYQLNAVAIGNVIQSLFQLIIGIIILRQMKVFKSKRLAKFDKETFKLIFSVGAKYQSIAILGIFFDPIAKFFITKGIGLSGTANYELANRIVSQGRNLLVNSNQVIIPKVVAHQTTNTLDNFFGNVIERNTLISVLLGLGIILLSPIAIIIFLGHFDEMLLLTIIIVNIGWVCNMITSIHYFTCMGIDKLNKLVMLHLLYSLIVMGCFFILLKTGINPITAILVPTISLFIGSVYNSMILSELKTSFTWIRSNAFIYFILVSLTVLLIPVSSCTSFIFILTGFFLLFLFLFRTRLKNLILNMP
jgi:O-antigen/teichoic acid export membrane protein